MYIYSPRPATQLVEEAGPVRFYLQDATIQKVIIFSWEVSKD